MAVHPVAVHPVPPHPVPSTQRAAHLDQRRHALELLRLVVLVDRLPVDPQRHLVLVEPLLLDEVLDALADDLILEVLVGAALLVGRALVVLVLRVARLVRVRSWALGSGFDDLGLL